MTLAVLIKGEAGSAAQVRVCRVSETAALFVTQGDASSGPLDSGLSYHAQHLDPALADATAIDILMIAPADGLMQVGLSFALGGDGTAELFEGTTVSANGNVLVAVNRNRNSANVAALQVFEGPTITDPGTRLSAALVPGGQGKKDSVGSGGGQADIILKKGEIYLFRMTNQSSAVQPASVAVNWAENPEG